MSAPKVGDRVRVVYEGTVSAVHLSDGGFDIDHGGASSLLTCVARPRMAKSIEVLPRPLKVGDTIEGDQYENAPVGTVVRGSLSGLHLIRVSGGKWICTTGDCDDHRPEDPRTVVYLPEPTP